MKLSLINFTLIFIFTMTLTSCATEESKNKSLFTNQMSLELNDQQTEGTFPHFVKFSEWISDSKEIRGHDNLLSQLLSRDLGNSDTLDSLIGYLEGEQESLQPALTALDNADIDPLKSWVRRDVTEQKDILIALFHPHLNTQSSYFTKELAQNTPFYQTYFAGFLEPFNGEFPTVEQLEQEASALTIAIENNLTDENGALTKSFEETLRTYQFELSETIASFQSFKQTYLEMEQEELERRETWSYQLNYWIGIPFYNLMIKVLPKKERPVDAYGESLGIRG